MLSGFLFDESLIIFIENTIRMKTLLIFLLFVLSSYQVFSQENNLDFTKAKHIASLCDINQYKHVEIITNNAKGTDRFLILSKQLKSVSEENGMVKFEYINGRISWLDVSGVYNYEIRPEIGVMSLFLSF